MLQCSRLGLGFRLGLGSGLGLHITYFLRRKSSCTSTVHSFSTDNPHRRDFRYISMDRDSYPLVCYSQREVVQAIISKNKFVLAPTLTLLDLSCMSIFYSFNCCYCFSQVFGIIILYMHLFAHYTRCNSSNELFSRIKRNHPHY